MSECKIIKAEKNRFEEKKKNRNSNGNNQRNSGDPTKRKQFDGNSRSNGRKTRFAEQQNNEITTTHVSEDESEEESIKEMNNLYTDVNTIEDIDVERKDDGDFTTEIKVKVMNSAKNKLLNSLIDS